MKRFVLTGIGLLFLIFAVGIYNYLTWPVPIPEIPKQQEKMQLNEGYLERLAQAVRFPTISTEDRAHTSTEALHNMHTWLQVTFPKVHQHLKREVINNYSLIYTWHGANSSLAPVCLMAHQDVVPVQESSLEDWTYPPFSGTIKDGFIWGRGTLDDKSSLVGIFEAIEHLLREGFQPQRDIYLAFGHDEEIGGTQGAKKIVEHFQKQNIRFAMVLDEGGLIFRDFMPGGPDVALVGIAEKGALSVTLEAKTIGGHASMPPQETSIGIISEAVYNLQENPFPANFSYLHQTLQYQAIALDPLKRLFIANAWATKPLLISSFSKMKSANAVIRTTTAPTILNAGVKDNVLPINASATINFRLIPGETKETVLQYIEETIDDPRVSIQPVGHYAPPSPVSDVDGPAFALISQSIYQTMETDKPFVVAPFLMVAGTDSRYFHQLSDHVYRFLFNILKAEDLERLHGTNERISIENYQKTINFYYNLLKNTNAMADKP